MPGATFIEAQLRARDLAAPAPRDSTDLVPAALHPLWIRRRSDYRTRVDHEAELARFSVLHDFGVLARFLARHERFVAKHQTTKPIHVGVAFPPWEKEPDRVALLRTQRLAVLAVGDDRVIERLLDRTAARELRCIATFGKKPLGARLYAHFTEERCERYARPLAVARQTTDLLRGRVLGRVPTVVPGALEKVDPRDRRKAFEIVDGEAHRAIHETMDRERVRRRIDRGDAGVVTLIVNVGRRDRADEILQRRLRRRRAGRALRFLEARARADLT